MNTGPENRELILGRYSRTSLKAAHWRDYFGMWGPNVQDTLKTHEEKLRQLKQASQGTCAAAASGGGAESQARRDLGLEVAEPATELKSFG